MNREESMHLINNSLAHTIGNVTSEIFSFILSLYPKDFFKTKYIDTILASREFSKIKHNAMDMHKSKPIIAIRPRLMTDRPEYMTTSYYNDTFGKNVRDMNTFTNSAVSTVIYDRDHKLAVDFSINRMKLGIEVVQVFETIMEQYNLYGRLMSVARIEHPDRLTRNIEVQIPTFVIEEFATAHNIDIRESAKICTIFNKISNYPLFTRLKTSTGKIEYFILVQTNIQYNIQNPSINEGEKEGSEQKNFSITFNMDIEFNYVDTFNVFNGMSDFGLRGLEYNNELLKETVIIPIISNTFKLPQIIDDDYFFYCASQVIPDISIDLDNSVDETNINELMLEEDEKLIFSYAKKHGITPKEAFSKLFKVIYYEDITQMKEDDRYTITIDEYGKITITLNNVSVDKEYNIVIYKNNISLHDEDIENHMYKNL